MNDSIENTPFRSISFITFEGISSELLYHYTLFYVMKGAIRIQTKNGNFFLDEQDVILLNPHENYTFYGNSNNMVLSIQIDNSSFSIGKSLRSGQFVCNSSVDQERDYAELRKQMSQIASVYFNKEDINHLHLAALGYQLLYYMNKVHYEENLSLDAISPDNKYYDRINQILAFIHQHYQEELSLQIVADYTHLSPSYLSKFFKKNMQTNFNQYLNQVRLQHALDDLTQTSRSITEIAQNNGFPNISTFNKVFKEEYQTTPNRYRLRLKEKEQTEILEQKTIRKCENPEEILTAIDRSIGENIPSISNIQLPGQQTIRIKSSKAQHTVKPIWRSMLDVGSCRKLRLYNLDKTLQSAVSQVPFQYGRIYHALSNEFLSQNESGKFEHFNLINGIGIILDAGLCPYIDLTDEIEFMELIDSSHKNNFSIDLDNYLLLVEDFLTYCISIYGSCEVERWVFEISWYCYYENNTWENPKAFAHRFAAACRLIKSYLPDAMVGGINYLSTIPTDFLHRVLIELETEKVRPDFISFSFIPYEVVTNRENLSGKENPKPIYSSDEHYCLHKLQTFRQVLEEHSCGRIPVYVSAVAPAMFNHRSPVLNDSCYQSSFFIQSTLDLLDEVDIVGYSQLADASSQPQESYTGLLDGRSGLISIYGIDKPGLLALSILKECGCTLIDKGENYMLTKSYRNTFHLIICNHIHVSDSFCMNLQDPPYDEIYSAFRAPRTLSINFSLEDMEEGSYTIIGFHINRESGSLLDEWQKIDFWNHPDQNELNYMRHVIHPKRTLIHRHTQDGRLSFPVNLAPHEVAAYTITKNL